MFATILGAIGAVILASAILYAIIMIGAFVDGRGRRDPWPRDSKKSL